MHSQISERVNTDRIITTEGMKNCGRLEASYAKGNFFVVSNTASRFALEINLPS